VPDPLLIINSKLIFYSLILTFFNVILDMCHKLISSNLDKLKKIKFQAFKNVIGNGSLIGYGGFYLMGCLWLHSMGSFVISRQTTSEIHRNYNFHQKIIIPLVFDS